MSDVAITADSPHRSSRLLGGFVPVDLASAFERRARMLNCPLSDALVGALSLWLAMTGEIKEEGSRV